MSSSSVEIKKDTANGCIFVCVQKSGIPIKAMTDDSGNIDYHTTIICHDHHGLCIDIRLHCDRENIISLTGDKILSFIREDKRNLSVNFKITPGNLEMCDKRVFVKGLCIKSPYYLRAVLSVPKKYIRKNMPKHCKGARNPFAKRPAEAQARYVGGNPFPLQGGMVSPK